MNFHRLFFYLLFFAAFSKNAIAQSSASDSLSPGKVVVRHISIEGNKRTKASVIYREMSVQEGNIISRDSLLFLLKQNNLRLYNTALFNDIEIDTIAVSANEMDWKVKVNERWYILPSATFELADRNFNVWWTEQHRDLRRANIGVTLTDYNFRGSTDQLSGTVQIGYTQKLALSYYRPYLDKEQHHGFGVSLSASQNQEVYYITDSNKQKFVHSNGYILRQYNGKLIYSYRPGYAMHYIFQLGYYDYAIKDTVLKLNPNYFEKSSKQLKMLELFYRFDINHADNWNYPLAGFKMVSGSTVRIGLEGMKFQAFINMETGIFKNLWRKWYFASVFRGRITLPEEQPYILNNALGSKAEIIRGYEYYVADGSQYGIIRFDLKRELFSKTFYKIPIPYLSVAPLRIYPKIFADAGYARNKYHGNSFLNNKLLYSAGAGVDVVTAYDIKVRFEYTINHLGQYGFYLHVISE